MAVTKFSEHTPDSPLTEYCSSDDVEVYLAGVAADDEGSPFQALLSRTRVENAINKWSSVVKALIDGHCGRDFDYHEDVDVVFDGTNSDTLNMKPFGFCPLVEVSALSIDGTTEDLDNYVTYTEDAVLARSTFVTPETPIFIGGVNTFAAGRQNVEATITWGYEHGSLPARVEAAAAYWVGACLLNPADAISDLRDPGMTTMVKSVTMGDMRVDMGSTHSPYATLAGRLKKQAKDLLARYVITSVSAPDPSVTAEVGRYRRYYRQNGFIR